jgi:CMP-N,N'-diacetyllegionaminic acid synthase
MLGSERVIAVIPARGGSKSVPYKNIKPLGGKPLIAWAIEVGKNTPEIDRVIVSTDDDKIASVAVQYGAEVYRRPSYLATDDALVIDALRDLIRTLQSEGESANIMVLLEPTCPLRSVEDVSDCLALLADGKDSSATFHLAELNPHRAWSIKNGVPEVFIPGAIPWLPRQKLPEAYQLNGAVYAFYINRLEPDSRALLVGKTGALIIPRNRATDIDEEVDFDIVEAIIRRRNG